MRWPGPRESYLAQREQIDAAMQRVLASGWYILGEEVAEFEREFSGYVGSADAVGVASGTDALVIALRGCGIGPGDAVATVSHTAVATVAAIEMVGARAVLVDVGPNSFVMDPESLQRSIDHVPGVRAVVPVHLYGHPADLPSICAIAANAGALVIEDAAQAHGALVEGKPVGSWGEAAAFSCYPTKNLGALGDAGVVTCTSQVAERIRLLRQYGWRERYVSDIPGMNSRLDPIQAAVLRVKLTTLDENNRRRTEVASWYDELLPEAVRKPAIGSNIRHAYHQYVIRVVDRDDLLSRLGDLGIPASVLYPQPVHLQPAYRNRLDMDPNGLEQSEEACRSLICLPMHPLIERSSVEQVCDVVRSWIESRE